MSNEFFEALKLLEREKGISAQILVEKIKTAILIAIKKDYPGSENINMDIDMESGKFAISILKNIVEEVEDPANEITLDEARTHSKRAKLGGICEIKLETKKFGRIAAQNAKQVINQGIKEVERNLLIEQYSTIENEAVSATVLKVEPKTGNITLSVDKNEVPLFRNEQVPGEVLSEGQIIKVYVAGILTSDRRPILKVSRTHKDLVKRLFELEVPEIYDGTVEVKSISREAGSRSKIAVYSKDENVDPVGACIGPKGTRVAKIVDELGGEKIDIIRYSDNPAEFIAQALAPADVVDVTIEDEEVKACIVLVPDHQLSLAIGNKGQNAKLAARLTGYKIDIKPESGYFGE
ncbi:MAG: transcription termination/antitermination protein NusA [Clostridiales bacterium]|nr:transcription termination/antitermination protein NusA [Clostridiales bacterium]